MKTMRNALNITADNHELVKAGYIQLPVPITIDTSATMMISK